MFIGSGSIFLYVPMLVDPVFYRFAESNHWLAG
jgi:hypothetical protein